MTYKTGNPCQSFNPKCSISRNHISTVRKLSERYDSNDNVLDHKVPRYGWDADGNSITVDGVSATYDALDRMVEQNRSDTYTETV